MAAWVPLATVSGNTLVKRTVTFAAFTTDRIRVNVTNALASYARITEIEAWGVRCVGRQQRSTGRCGGGEFGVEHLAGYPLVTVNDNERAGVNWGSGGGGWADATANAYPDWVQINFNGSKSIDRVVVYTLQDNYAQPGGAD